MARVARVKTGCVTCRIRKVKCGEQKPNCQQCVKSGRTCDGYTATFKVITSQPAHAPRNDSIAERVRQFDWSISNVLSCKDISLLNHLFSIKSLHNIDLACQHEAYQILRASLDSVPLRCAIISLQALREELERNGDDSKNVALQDQHRRYGLMYYNMAIDGLISNLSETSPKSPTSALLCCQIFISIEQLLKNYKVVGQHIIRGLRIMHAYRARPGFIAADSFLTANRSGLPLLDVFLIKLFAAPCRFEEAPGSGDSKSSRIVANPNPSSAYNPQHQEYRTIAPDLRKDLVSIAMSALAYLDGVALAHTADKAKPLLRVKDELLESLESWTTRFRLVKTQATANRCPEPIAWSFWEFLQCILRSVLVASLDYSPETSVRLDVEDIWLQDIADRVDGKIQNYVICMGRK